MARASYATLLPLDQWAQIMGISPWHINQFGQGLPGDQRLQSPHVWAQFDYQVDFLSREELAYTIGRAEQMIADELRYWPAPKYIVGEELPYTPNFRPTIYGYGGTPRGDYKALQSNYTKIVGPGIRAFTLIGTTAVAYSDSDGDGLNDTFTATLATSVTNVNEISVAFAAADRYGSAPIDDTWLIRPVRISISGGNVTVKGPAGMLGKPGLQARLDADPGGMDATDATNFVTTVEIYWDRLDGTVVAGAGNTANQGQAEWEGNWTVPPGSVQYLPIAQIARNADAGLVGIDWLLNGGQCPPQYREPDRVILNYLSGIPYLTGSQMAQPYADIVAFLTAGLLAAGRAGDERSARIIDFWNKLPNHGDSSRPMTAKEIDDCPFGVTRGGLWAWQRVRRLRSLAPAVF